MPGVAHTGVDWDSESARETKVPGDECVWCKRPRAEWQADVEPVRVGDEETICSNCLGDLRTYGRYQKIMINVSSDFGPAVRAIVLDYMEELAQELTERFPDDPDMYYIPTMLSNASGKEDIDHDEGSRID